MYAELARKALKTFNLTTANAILMTLTTIMYLNKIFNLTIFCVHGKSLRMVQKLSYFWPYSREMLESI